jgi:hypothetical protein
MSITLDDLARIAEVEFASIVVFERRVKIIHGVNEFDSPAEWTLRR